MKHLEYYGIVQEQMKRQFEEEKENIEQAAKWCADSIQSDRVIHAFGCGHSQMFGMEIFYRAGGLVPINAMLLPHGAVYPKASLATFQERIEGFSQEYLSLENTSEKDTMIIVSISGRNPAVIDMALAAKEKGMKVIGLISKDYSSNVTSRHSNGKNLSDVVDLMIDIKCIQGDACLSHENVKDKFNGTSTILGMFVMNAITARAIEICADNGYDVPVFVSGNLDRGDAINKKHIAKYRGLVSNL